MIKTSPHTGNTRRHIFSSAKFKYLGLVRSEVHVKIVSNQNASIHIRRVKKWSRKITANILKQIFSRKIKEICKNKNYFCYSSLLS